MLYIYEDKLYKEGLEKPTLWTVDGVIAIAYPLTEEVRQNGRLLTKRAADGLIVRAFKWVVAQFARR